MRKHYLYNSDSGISLVAVIITIVVIIILVAISIFSAFNTPDNAAMAKYVQEFEEVRKGVETKRIINSKENISFADKGFSKVYVSGDIPYDFMSIGDGEPVAYLVNLNYIGYDELTTGKDYKRFEAEGDDIKTVVFGEDDVYVYDSTGKVYYVQGFLTAENITIYDNTSHNNSIKILKVDKVFNPDKTLVKATIIVESKKEIASVKVGDKNATKVDDGKYEIDIDKNGKYKIEAKDIEGNTDKKDLSITGIGGSNAPSVSAVVTNGTLEGDTYKITEKTAKIKLTSDTAKSLHIGMTPDLPSDWLAYSENVERYFEENGEKTLYIWVKDENGNINGSAYVLKILVEIDNGSRPTFSGEKIENGEITFEIIPGNDVWAKTKQVKIIFSADRQSNGYQSKYRTKASTGDWSRWILAYTNEIMVNINKSGTKVGAQIVYSSVYNNKDIASSEIEVLNIDNIPPKITSLAKSGTNKIRGQAIDSESGLATAPYLITQQFIDFENVADVNDYTWLTSNEVTVTVEGKYYFYVRDKAGNVAYNSINISLPDTTPPVIDSITSTSKLDCANIKTLAHDNVGITAYALTRSGSDIPTSWSEITETVIASIEHKTLRDEGDYYVWVRDAAGNTSVGHAIVKLFAFPVLDNNYPTNLIVKVNQNAEFKVIIATDGSPSEYIYAWYVSKDGGTTWNVIAGATESVYSFTTKNEDNNNLYKCAITNARGTIESKIAKLEVVAITADEPSISISEDKEMVLGGVVINNGDTETSSSTLSLKVAAINAAEVNISETDTKSATWVKYSDVISYTLKDASNGTKTISVWIRDSGGNELNKVVTSQITKK